MPEQKNNNETIKYQGKILEIVERVHIVEGKEKVFEMARRAPGTRLIIDLGNDELLLTKEYRYELNDFDYRLPGGKVYDSLDEYNQALASSEDMEPAITAAAMKEAKEEVGITSADAEKFAVSKCGATVDWDLHYYVITNPEIATQNLENGENIQLVRVGKEEAKEMCLNGQISEERSAMNLLKYLHLQK